MPARHGGAVVLATVEVEAEESLERTSSRLVYQDADLKKKRRRKERDLSSTFTLSHHVMSSPDTSTRLWTSQAPEPWAQ
jgi:hypothetical protein